MKKETIIIVLASVFFLFSCEKIEKLDERMLPINTLIILWVL
jgi:hypothetical protein